MSSTVPQIVQRIDAFITKRGMTESGSQLCEDIEDLTKEEYVLLRDSVLPSSTDILTEVLRAGIMDRPEDLERWNKEEFQVRELCGLADFFQDRQHGKLGVVSGGISLDVHRMIRLCKCFMHQVQRRALE